MPNEGGVNQFQGFKSSPPAGQLADLSRAAPMPGTPALGAPKQAQRKAVKGSQSESIGQAPPTQVTDQAQIAEVWRTLSGYTDDPLVHEYAQKAQGV